MDRFYQHMTRPETPDEARRVTAVRPAVAPLPQIRVGALVGLLELLSDRGGRVDLHRLADDLQFEVDDLLPLMDAAALLGLARVEEGDAILTGEGEAFAQASTLERKDRFRRIVLEHPTLVTRIHSALAAKTSRRLSEAFFWTSSKSISAPRRRGGSSTAAGGILDEVGAVDCPAVPGRQSGRAAASMQPGATVLSCGVLSERGRRQGIILVMQRVPQYCTPWKQRS